MPFWLLLVVTAIYAWVAFAFFRSGQSGRCVMYAGYAFANIGALMLVDR